MKMSATYSNLVIFFSTFALLLMAAIASPIETDEETSESNLVVHGSDEDMRSPWDTINAAALRKLLLQLESDDRMNRVGRSWPSAEPRSWAGSARGLEGRLARQWRADKRQVRFRQCYFNPISCFRK